MVNEEIYGCDYSSIGGITSNGDIMLVEGLNNAKQAIRNQLVTPIGTYPEIDEFYGSRIREIWGEDFNKENIEALKIHIANALYSQERVRNILNIEYHITVDKKIKINIAVELVDGSEENIELMMEE